MSNLTDSHLKAIMSSYDFSPFKTVVDVGGGQGSLLITILKTYPELGLLKKLSLATLEATQLAKW
ncbi:methyltransferase [Scytonema hofmannii]|uniref:methyltransferase n=1 Tax=Scytonema hofmannii TaxID=34078 RepID=UPI00034A15E9|nr:methyltransferase [Scytonema hofmannii]